MLLGVIVGGVEAMKNTTRAIRRHHRARMLQRAIRKIKIWESNPTNLMWRALRSYNHLAICSCSMCGNERNNLWYNSIERLTFAERRNLDSFNDQMKDLDLYGEIEDNVENEIPESN